MKKQDVIDFIANGFTLASLPESFHKLTAIANDPHSNLDEVVEVVRQDAELAANLLRLANSPYYANSASVATIEEAAQTLGLRAVVESALALGMIKAIHIDADYFDLTAFWRRSLSIAYLTEPILQRLPDYLKSRADANALFTAGLLHDMGLLVLIQGFPETMLGVVQHALNSNLPLQDAEQEKLGFNHQDVGRVLFKKWGLPEQLMAVAGYHHKPLELPRRIYAVMVDVVHIADYVYSAHALERGRASFKPTLQNAVWERSGIDPGQTEEISKEADNAANAADALLQGA